MTNVSTQILISLSLGILVSGAVGQDTAPAAAAKDELSLQSIGPIAFGTDSQFLVSDPKQAAILAFELTTSGKGITAPASTKSAQRKRKRKKRQAAARSE